MVYKGVRPGITIAVKWNRRKVSFFVNNVLVLNMEDSGKYGYPPPYVTDGVHNEFTRLQPVIEIWGGSVKIVRA